MARPTKQGIDYFPVDIQFDNKTEMYLIEKEAIGLAVLITLWQLIYADNGYYIIDNDDLRLLVKKRINVNINDINDCINVAINRGIFDEKLHKKNKILTSKAIQKRYFDASKRKKEVLFNRKFIINGINVNNNSINVDNNQDIDGGNATNTDVDVNVNTNTNTKEKFEEFRKAYPGSKRGLDTEFDNFKAKNKDYKIKVGFLLPAILEQIKIHNKKIETKVFCPPYKNIQIWINQKCWEVEEAIPGLVDIEIFPERVEK